jgi:hypothetical protein
MRIFDCWQRTMPAALIALSACVTASPTAMHARSVEPVEPVLVERAESNPVRDFGPIALRTVSDIHARISAHVRNIGATRTVDAVFTLDQDAYVLIGHLGADGRIKVMYPGTPGAPALVRAGDQIETQPLSVPEDRLVNGYAQQVARTRMVQAIQDSYDGRGIGYVFIVASSEPLNTADFIEGDHWTWLEATDYLTTSDPRIEVRELADELATPAVVGLAGATYTLEFAPAVRTIYAGLDSYSDYAYSDYAFADCSYGSGFSPYGFGLGWAIAPAYTGAWYRGVASPFIANWGASSLSTSWFSPFGGASGYPSSAYGGAGGCGYSPGYYGFYSPGATGFGPTFPLFPTRPDTSHGRRLVPGDTAKGSPGKHPFYPHHLPTPQSQSNSTDSKPAVRPPMIQHPATTPPPPRVAPPPRVEAPHVSAPPPAPRPSPPPPPPANTGKPPHG